MGVRPLRRGRISRENAQPPSEMSIFKSGSGILGSATPCVRALALPTVAASADAYIRWWGADGQNCYVVLVSWVRQNKARKASEYFSFCVGRVWQAAPRKAESDATIWISVYKRDGWLLGPFVHKLTATKVVSHGYLIRRTWLPFTLCTEPRETHATPFDACAPWSNPSLRHPRRLLFPTL